MNALAQPPAQVTTIRDGPALPLPPELSERGRQASRFADRLFKALNGSTTIPLLRAGLGPWMGTPVGGWLLLLRVRGRRSGVVREIPLSYFVDEGSAWVMAGFGPRTQWYQNLLAEPIVDVVLPGRIRRCRAEEVLDRATRARIMPRLLRATGVPGFMSGCDPWRTPEEGILEVTRWVPLIRLSPLGEPLVAGPDDPGGLGWIWRQAVVLAGSIWLARSVVRVTRGTVRRCSPVVSSS